MNQKKFSEMSKEEQEKFIAINKAKSAAAYQKRLQANKEISIKRKEFKAKVHQGNKYLDEAQTKIRENKSGKTFFFDIVKFGPFDVAFGVLPVFWDDDKITCRLAYAIKSPTDKYKENVAKGLIGHRISKQEKYYLYAVMPRDTFEFDETAVKVLASNLVVNEIIQRKAEIPQRVINALFNRSIKAWKKASKCTPCNQPECQDCNPQ